jgi:hypothetical protein
MTQSSLTTSLFPNPEKRGVIMEPVCWDLEFHIWRLLLDHIISGEPLPLVETQAKGFQDKKTYTNTSFLLHNSHFKNQTVALQGDTPGVITYDFPQNDRYIMRAILANTRKLKKEKMVTSLQGLPEESKQLISQEIENTDELWFGSVFVTMLSQVGVGLTVPEITQLIENLHWFHQQYR